MVDERIVKLAELMVDYSLEVKPNDKVFIRAGFLAEPLIRQLYRKLIQKGAHPYLTLDFPGAENEMLTYGSNEQIEYIHEPAKVMYEKYDCLIRILAEENTKALSNADPDKMTRMTKARGPLMKTYMERSARGFPNPGVRPGRGYEPGGIREFCIRRLHAGYERPGGLLAGSFQKAGPHCQVAGWQKGCAPGGEGHRPAVEHRRAQVH
jgi:hypothetical protein